MRSSTCPDFVSRRPSSPMRCTPLTIGIIALVDGSVSGQGRIDWDARGARSSGAFATDNMNLAAPFGPVEGLSTRLEFTDLLGLTSAPGQEARVRVVRTGIDVFDGIVRYQLRPDYHVAVESARWPLRRRHAVARADHARFQPALGQGADLPGRGARCGATSSRRSSSAISMRPAPMTGSSRCCSIRMAAASSAAISSRGRAGGTLSYIGELSDRDLGAYGVLAFDALKSLRYSRLEITLDGALCRRVPDPDRHGRPCPQRPGAAPGRGRDQRPGLRPGAEPALPAFPSISTSASRGRSAPWSRPAAPSRIQAT